MVASQRKHRMRAGRWGIERLVDMRVLQELQDWFSETTGISVSLRGPDGRLLTRSSHTNAFCRYVHTSPAGCEACRQSNQRAYDRAAAAVQSGRQAEPVKYVCHAGLTQFAAPIAVGRRCVATLVVGDRPTRPLKREAVAALARRIGLSPDVLAGHAEELRPWSDEEMGRAIRFLVSVAGTLTRLGYQSHLLRERLRQLTSLYETSRLLTSTLDHQEVLNLIAREVTRALGMQACSIRLLARGGRELAISSYYNLSKRYVDKGPVVVARSLIDQQALKGKMVTIRDMTSDRRVMYPDEARREGLRSGVAVPLIAHGRPVGALHLYSGQDHVFTPEEKRIIRAMANHAATAIENARLFRDSEEKRRLDKEILAAKEIQERLLPLSPPDVPGFDISALSQPSRSVGGDFYDFIRLSDDRLGIVVGDVSGKGIPAAILMAGTRAALRAQAESLGEADAGGPGRVLERVNKALCRDTSSNQFVSIFYGVLDIPGRTLTYANAGHNLPLLLNREEQWLGRGGLVVGAAPDTTYQEGTVRLEKGGVLVFYTDGITEALDAQVRPFGTERLASLVRRRRRRRAAVILQAVYDAVREYTHNAPPSDDRTLVVVRAI